MPAKDVIVTGNFTLVDAIEDVIANDNTYQIYTIDGKPVNSLQKGVNIIRYPNGQTLESFYQVTLSSVWGAVFGWWKGNNGSLNQQTLSTKVDQQRKLCEIRIWSKNVSL